MEQRMIEDIQYVETPTVRCEGDGKEPNIGHPLVYLNLGREGKVKCPYCGRAFIFKKIVDRV